MAFGHCYMEELPRRKWSALTERHPNVHVCVVTPKTWPDAFKTLVSVPRCQERLSFVPLATVGSGYGSRYFFSSRQLPRLMRSFRPDIVHVDHEPWSVAYAQISCLAEALAPSAKRVVFSWWNAPRAVPFPWSVIHRWCLARTTLIIAGNHDTAATHRAHDYTGPTVVMPQLGVDVDSFSPGSENPSIRLQLADGGSDPGTPVVGFVGRLIPDKGVDILLKALHRIRHLRWQAVIVGSGPAQASLERQARELGIAERTAFVGAVPQERVADWMRTIRILVLPSTRAWREQFGHVLVEAMACGAAVVGSDSGEIPHVIGSSGFVFPDGDHDALAGFLTKLIDSPTLVHSMGQCGRERVLAQYSDLAIAERLYTVYSELASRGQ
jgi:glycosyltransferase involved in cell wall biosynthesis